MLPKIFLLFALELLVYNVIGAPEAGYDYDEKSKFRRLENSIAEMPYIVYIEFDSLYHPELVFYHGAGTIIDVNIVWTTARHCEMARKHTIRVYAGETYVRPYSKEYRVAEYVLHPKRKGRLGDAGKQEGYRLDLLYNHCLLRLKEPLVFGPYIQKAPLPFSFERQHGLWMYRVSGWGPFDNVTTMQGEAAHQDKYEKYTRAGLFYHETQRTWQDACRYGIREHHLEPPEDPFCINRHRPNYRVAYGDCGGPVMEVQRGTVFGIVQTITENLGELWHNVAKATEAVDWINELRAKWVPMVT